MKTNIFMLLLLFVSVALLGPSSYANMSDGARKAQKYFKHDNDKRKIASESSAKKKIVKAIPQGKKVKLSTKKSKKLVKNKSKLKIKSKFKPKRQVAGKGVPLILPKKKTIASETDE